MPITLEVCGEFHEALAALRGPFQRRPLLIGVDGPSGSGKTTFSYVLGVHLQGLGCQVMRLRFDPFWVDGQEYKALLAVRPELAERRSHANDHAFDWRLCRDQLLALLRAGGSPDAFQQFLIARCGHGAPPGDPSRCDVVILEGTTCLRRELRIFYDLRLMLQLDPQACLGQLLAREQEVGAGYDLNAWMPQEKRYLESHKPLDAADFVVDSLPARSAFQLMLAA